MKVYENIADSRRVAQPAGEDWTNRRYRSLSIFLSIPLARAGFSANLITIIGAVLGFVGAVALGFPYYKVRVVGAGLLISSRLLDYVDGEVARINQKASKYGVFLEAVSYDILRRLLFLPLGYGLFRSTNKIAYLLFAFSPAVFVPGYEMAYFFAEWVGLPNLAGNQGLNGRLGKTVLLRKALKPFYFLMKQTTPLIVVGAIMDRLSWVLLYYAIAAPMLFFLRVWRLSQRLRRDR